MGTCTHLHDVPTRTYANLCIDMHAAAKTSHQGMKDTALHTRRPGAVLS